MDRDKAKRELSPKALQILDAATKCFAERGFHGTRTADIARAAGVGEGTIYNHFTDKLGLFVCVIERIVNQFEHLREVAFEGCASVTEAFLETNRACEDFLKNNHDYAEILARAIMLTEVNRALKDFLDEHFQNKRETIEGVARECGLALEGKHIEALAWAAMGGHQMLLTDWVSSGFATESPGLYSFTKLFVEVLQIRGRKAGELQ